MGTRSTRETLAIAYSASVLLTLGLSGGTATASPKPAIQDITPRQAYYDTVVTIKGSGFGGVPGRVTFAGATSRLRADTHDWTDKSIKAKVPYLVNPGNVYVKTADGQTSNGFFFTPPCFEMPVIKSISPSPAMQCEVVKIKGCGFGGHQYRQQLTFNGVDATGRLIGNWSEEELLIRVPDDVTSGPVVITNPRGVPSPNFPFRIRDDTPEWDAIRTIDASSHSFEIELEVGEVPEEGDPGVIRVHASHPTCLDCPARDLPIRWRSATAFEQSHDDGRGTKWKITGYVNPAASTVEVTHEDQWQWEQWHNSSTGESRVCMYKLKVAADLPIFVDGFGDPSFNVWQPRFSFWAEGDELRRRAHFVSFKQHCAIYDDAIGYLRRDGQYELIGVDWESSSIDHTFEGDGTDPCRDPNPTWGAKGDLYGLAYTSAPDPNTRDLLLPGWPRVPLPYVPVVLYHSPIGGTPTEIARTIAGEDGRYRFRGVPLQDDLQLEVALEYHGSQPPPYRVTHERANQAPREPIRVRSHTFSNRDSTQKTVDVLFDRRGGTSTTDLDHLDDLALTYAHTAQALKAAGKLQLELDIPSKLGEALEIRSYSPDPATKFVGHYMAGPAAAPFGGPLTSTHNVHVNIAAADSPPADGGRPMNREWHEFGHYVQADIQGNYLPAFRDTPHRYDTNHDGRLNPSTVDSFAEGFAEFYALLVARNVTRDPQPQLYRLGGAGYNLDVNYTTFWFEGKGVQYDEEFAVASLLWDLVDIDDGFDLRPMGVTQDLLNAWGFQLTNPLTSDIWPPVIYSDQIHLDQKWLLTLLQHADKIRKTYPNSTASPNAHPDYHWIVDVETLYLVLKQMGVGQYPGAHGLTALDELFVVHGFFADTAPQNLCYDAGEHIGVTDNHEYTVSATHGTQVVPAQPVRNAPVSPSESSLRFMAHDSQSGRPVAVTGFRVDVAFAEQYAGYDYHYETVPEESGYLPLPIPDPVYETTLTITPRGDGHDAKEPLVLTSSQIRQAATRGGGQESISHTFDMQRRQVHLYFPIYTQYSPRENYYAPREAPPPTAPSAGVQTAQLLELINAERRRVGVRELAVSQPLAQAADWFATEMAARDDYRADHSDHQGRTVAERLRAFGYSPEGHETWLISENMARGQAVPEDVLQDWWDSPVHHDNMLDPAACEVGIGYGHTASGRFGHYWVADFGCRTALTPTPSFGLPAVTVPPPTSTDQQPATPTATTSAGTPGTPPATSTRAQLPTVTPTGPTQQPPASATPTTTSAAPTPRAQLVFADDFCDPTSGWPSGETDRRKYGYWIGMSCEYRIVIKTAPWYMWATPKVALGEDYAVETSTYPVGAGMHGLSFGLNEDRSRFYIAVVDSRGRYALFRNESDNWTPLIPFTSSPRVDPGFGNTLQVESWRGNLSVYIDGELMGTVNDGRSHAGDFGVYAEAYEDWFDARFTGYRAERLE